VTAGLAALADLVHRESGILVREAQYDALGAALRRAHPGVSAERFLALSASPTAGPRLIAQLLDETTIKETFFLRDARQLESISWPALLQQARKEGAERIRVWSAACATGEEPYSLALLACEAFGSLHPPVTILATDISGEAVALARAGEYRKRSVRHLESAQRRRYFREAGDVLVVGDNLRALVTVALHNLVLDPSPPPGQAPFHLILCRNVLIYFDAETVERVIASLGRALTPHGSVVLGAADALCGSAGRLRALVAGTAGEPTRMPAVARTLRRPLGRAAGSAEPQAHPADAIGCLLRGLAELESSDAAAAVVSFRRALYLEPRLGLAAFQLGRAHEALGDRGAAGRAYEQSVRTLERSDVAELHEAVLGQVDLDDIVLAVRMRLDALAAVGFGGVSRPSPLRR
jgi:chemotaxis methyl-accepting protein methylase